jgi:hypothetical protein
VPAPGGPRALDHLPRQFDPFVEHTLRGICVM